MALYSEAEAMQWHRKGDDHQGHQPWPCTRPIKPQNLAVNLGPCRTKSYGHSSPAFAPCLQLQPCCAAQGSQAWRAEPSGAAAAQSASHPQCRAATASQQNKFRHHNCCRYLSCPASTLPVARLTRRRQSSPSLFLLLALLAKKPKAL